MRLSMETGKTNSKKNLKKKDVTDIHSKEKFKRSLKLQERFKGKKNY